MALENITPIGCAARAPMVSRDGQSRRHARWAAEPFPEPEPPSKAGIGNDEDVEFSMLDPEIGAILAEVNPAVYAFVAARIGASRK